MTPIPDRVDDPKNAVLYSVLNSMEQIDANTSSRMNYAQSILFRISANLDEPCFSEEIRQIKDILGIKTVEPEPEPVIEQTEPVNEVAREEAIFREL